MYAHYFDMYMYVYVNTLHYSKFRLGLESKKIAKKRFFWICSCCDTRLPTDFEGLKNISKDIMGIERQATRGKSGDGGKERGRYIRRGRGYSED